MTRCGAQFLAAGSLGAETGAAERAATAMGLGGTVARRQADADLLRFIPADVKFIFGQCMFR
jgi:hypothetical protein